MSYYWLLYSTMYQNRNRQEFFKYHHIIIFSRPLAIAQKSLVYIMNVRVSICGNKVVSYLPLYIKWHSHWSILIFKDMQNILILVSRLKNTYPIPEFWRNDKAYFYISSKIIVLWFSKVKHVEKKFLQKCLVQTCHKPILWLNSK